MEKSELQKKIDELDKVVKRGIAYMEKNPSHLWDDERREVAGRTKEALQERKRFESQLEKNEEAKQ